ncbi:hypothetical protein [Zunongwangia sp. HRR-M8]|uniref:hypothetical protein n=1 Tax=Zunongwangia sp. HRR-M8 TaxID=3015170 RepID=UPI0022DE0BA0|nr:hypothetical protein [Zunongwangia sp. HRR-M8]WBL22143.1 hypothetical protein PBT89_15695 [Zunongwangia sp. HRR-M8]
MSNTNNYPLFYVDNLQKAEGESSYTVDLHLPENFNYVDEYHVIGTSTLLPEVLKIQLLIKIDNDDVTPSPISKTVSVPFVLTEDENGSYFKFIITWQLNGTTEGGGVGNPEDEETVGESVLQGVG